jgi:hypothetical protein
MVFTAIGLILGPQCLGVLRLNVATKGLRILAELTLAMVLFTDAPMRTCALSDAASVSPSGFCSSACR